MMAMQKMVNNNHVNIVVNPLLDHNAYNEYDDVFEPLREFFEHFFPKVHIIDTLTTAISKNIHSENRISILENEFS